MRKCRGYWTGDTVVGNVRLLTYTEQDNARQKAEMAEQSMQAERGRHLAARRSAETRIAELERRLVHPSIRS